MTLKMLAEVRRTMCDKVRILTEIENKVPKRNHRAEEYNPSQTILKNIGWHTSKIIIQGQHTPIPKAEKDTLNKENYRAIFLMQKSPTQY